MQRFEISNCRLKRKKHSFSYCLDEVGQSDIFIRQTSAIMGAQRDLNLQEEIQLCSP